MKRRGKDNNIPWKNATKRKSSCPHPKSKKSQKLKTKHKCAQKITQINK